MEAAQGCEDPLRGTKASTEAEAQDVCHQLLDSPFRECHVQVWVGVEVVSTTREVGRMGASEVPNGIWSCHCFVCTCDLRGPFWCSFCLIISPGVIKARGGRAGEAG